MPSKTLWQLHKTDITGASAGNFTLPGIRDRNLELSTEVYQNRASGDVFNTFVAMKSQEPMLSFTTSDIETALTNIPLRGEKIDDAAGMVVWIAKLDIDGNNLGTLQHTKFVARQGVLYNETLTAQGDDECTLACRFAAIKEDGQDIWADTVSQTLPAMTEVTEKFKFAKLVLNTTDVDGVDGVTINYGGTYSMHKNGGEIWPQKVFWRANPRIEINTTEAGDNWDTFELVGTEITSWEIWLRALDNDANEYADGAAQHIKIYGNNAYLGQGPVGGNNDSPLTSGMFLVPRMKGQTPATDDPILYTFNTAIV